METSIVSCLAIEPDRYGYATGYSHTCNFPEEWDAETQMLLTGIYISEGLSGLFTYDIIYYNLRITITSGSLIIDDDPNLLSKFNVPVIIDKAMGSMGEEYIYFYAEREIRDLTITFQWRSISFDYVDGINIYSLRNDVNSTNNPLTRPIFEGECVYLQIWILDTETDKWIVQPADELDLPENMAWTIVSPTIIRVDGSSEERHYELRLTEFPTTKYYSYNYCFVSVTKN